MDQYRTKVKKPYTGPPRPTLMGHDKNLRQMQEQLNLLTHNLSLVQDENRQLKNRINFLETQINKLLYRKF